MCAWCQKNGTRLFTLKTSSGTKAFCSEVCFTQCRRASFKKNKVCDWCKHVRHTVNYVDFQDGEQQLQFCSAKCLNQYKMSIFCRETQEHLKQIRSPSDIKKSKSNNDEQILITPELWLKDGSKIDNSEKESKLSVVDKDLDNKHRHSKAEKNDSETLSRDRSSSHLSKSLPDRLSRERRRSTPKEKSSTPISALTSDLGSNMPQGITPVPPGNMPALSQLIPPQLWNMFAPTMPQFGGMPPWFYPGFIPPMQGMMPPNFPMDGVRNGNEISAQHPPVSPVVSEDSIPEVNETRKLMNGNKKPHQSSKRTSNFADQQFSHSQQGNSNASRSVNNFPHQPHGNRNGIPPVTMIMPVPVALPFPVPIPLPLPLTMEKIMEVFDKKNNDDTKIISEKSLLSDFGNHMNGDSHHVQLSSSNSEGHNSLASSVLFRQTPHKLKSDINENETTPAGRLSCNSCLTERSASPNSVSDDSSTLYDSRLSLSYDYSQMRKRGLSPDGSLDLSKRSRISIPLSNSSNSCDAAMDLTKDSNVGRLKSDSGKENREINDTSSVQSDPEGQNGDGKEPKIHIITPRDDPPLSQQLPLAPADHKYSNRRGLILDIPYNPRRSRSPSPERRPYVARDYRADRGRRRIVHGIRNIKSK